MANVYLTPKEVETITSWRSKTHPDQIRSTFNIDLYIKIKNIRHERKQEHQN